MKKKEYTGVALMVSSAMFTSVGQLLWKLSNAEIGIEMFIGFALYVMGALLMIAAFRFGDLSRLHPLLCLSYVFAIALGYFVLNESVSFIKILGVITIITGVIFIAGGSK